MSTSKLKKDMEIYQSSQTATAGDKGIPSAPGPPKPVPAYHVGGFRLDQLPRSFPHCLRDVFVHQVGETPDSAMPPRGFPDES